MSKLPRVFFAIAAFLMLASKAWGWQERCTVLGSDAAVIRAWNTEIGFQPNSPLWATRPQKAWVFCSIKASESDQFSIYVNDALVYTGRTSGAGQWEGFCLPVDPAILKPDSWSIRISSPCQKSGDCEIRDYGLAFGPESGPVCQMYEGIIHLHTKYSDGVHSFDERKSKAQSYGYVFMVITDHEDQIDKHVSETVNGAKVNMGFASYFNEGRSHTDKDFVTITGFEMESPWTDSNGKHSSHMLVFPWLGASEDPDFQAIDNKSNQVMNVIRLCDNNMVCTSNHPFSKQVGMDFLFDFAEYATKGMSRWPAVELMNNWSDGQYGQEVAKGNEAVEKRIKTNFYSGCDSHNAFYPNDLDAWKHATLIFADTLTLEALVAAFRNGQTIALDEGAILNSGSMLPDGVPFVTDAPHFVYSVKFKENLPKLLKGSAPFDITVCVYRDGMKVPASQRKYAKGTKTISYDWSDTDVTPGYHRYIVEMTKCVVTSPIEVLVVK